MIAERRSSTENFVSKLNVFFATPVLGISRIALAIKIRNNQYKCGKAESGA